MLTRPLLISRLICPGYNHVRKTVRRHLRGVVVDMRLVSIVIFDNGRDKDDALSEAYANAALSTISVKRWEGLRTTCNR